MDLPDEPTPAELEMMNDEARKLLGKGPLPRSPEQGIKDMQARIEFLNGELRKVATNLSRLGSTEHEIRTLETARRSLQADLREANERLHEYELQKQSGN